MNQKQIETALSSALGQTSDAYPDITADSTLLDLLRHGTVKSRKKWFGSKRLRAKWCRYTWRKKLPKEVRHKWIGMQLATPIREYLNYEGLFRQAFGVHPIPIQPPEPLMGVLS